jgi:prepilin-type N-terminal cleavage/methylation domain-containing protein
VRRIKGNPASNGTGDAMKRMWSVVSKQWVVGSGQWAVGCGQWAGGRLREMRRCRLSPASRPTVSTSCRSTFSRSDVPPLHNRTNNAARRRVYSGFTLIELLVTITIIGILAGMTFGVMQVARETACEAATKATIVKLNNIIMHRYESYLTRRVPISTTGLTPKQAAEVRLTALRELMRMEMPERWSDIYDPAVASSKPVKPDIDGSVTVQDVAKSVSRSLPRSALSKLYAKRYINIKMSQDDISPDYVGAECLYMIVSLGSPEAMEQFHPSEIGDVDNDGLPEFLDGWGHPIMFLRWAPGLVGSGIQTGTDHDPFDTRKVQKGAFHLIPLIYSAGPNGKYGIDIQETYVFAGDPFGTEGSQVGKESDKDDNGTLTDYQDNITNHQIEAR